MIHTHIHVYQLTKLNNENSYNRACAAKNSVEDLNSTDLVNTDQSNNDELIEKINGYIAENCPQLVLDKDSYPMTLAQNEGYDAFVEYMETPQSYELLTRVAGFGIGHHLIIRLPGGRTCEWSNTPGDISQDRQTQRESREALGATIEKMWCTHRKFIPNYSTDFGRLTYRPFLNDCHTYVNKILVYNGEPRSTLKRFV